MDLESEKKQPPSQVSIFDISSNVVQVVCQLLIDVITYQGGGAWDSLGDVISLRSTCVHFRDVINNVVLFVPCDIDYNWLADSPNKDLLSFLDFMKFETSWRFYSFNYRIRRTKQFDNMPLLHKYESLFTKSVHQISMDLSETNYSSINNLAQWLESVAMKPKARFRVNFVGSFLPLSNPGVVTESDYEADTPDDLTESIMRDLSLYTNLRELNLWRKFPVSSLKWFPCLTSLFLRHLDCSNVTNVKNLPNIAVLDIGVQENSDIELLPDAINKFFPCLEYFGLGLEKNTNVDADFSCLPTSCQFLQIPSYLLRNFANCCHLKSLYLINDGEIAESFDHFQHGSQLQVKVLQVLYLYGSCRPRSSLFGIVSDLITQWKSLEVISIKMGGYTMGRGFHLLNLIWTIYLTVSEILSLKNFCNNWRKCERCGLIVTFRS